MAEPQVIHFEIVGRDHGALQRYYSAHSSAGASTPTTPAATA